MPLTLCRGHRRGERTAPKFIPRSEDGPTVGRERSGPWGILEGMSVNAFLTPSTEPRRKRRLKLGSWALAGLPAVVLAYLPQIDLQPGADVPGAGFIPALQAMIWPLCALALLAALVFLACRRVVAGVLLIIAVVAAGLASRVPDPTPELAASAEQVQQRRTVQLMSVNASYGEVDADAVVDAVLMRNVSVLVIQEATEGLIDRLNERPAFKQLFTHRTGALPEVGADGTIILATGPVKEETPAWPDGGRHFEQRTAVVTVPGFRPIRVMAVHTLPPTADAGVWRDELDTLGAYQRSKTDLPLVVAGDFNATEAMPGYREATRGLDDAARVSGWWPQPTWPQRPLPLTQLDHVLVRGLGPAAWERVQLPGTDHRSVVTGLHLPED